MLFNLVLDFVLGFIIGVLSSLLYRERNKRHVSYDDYNEMFGWTYSCSSSRFKGFLKLINKFNGDDVRYLIVTDLPPVEEVVDRRAVYIQLDFICDNLCDYTMYTCVSGLWCQVDTTDMAIDEYLGRV